MTTPQVAPVSALRDYLNQLSVSQFWGSITLKFQRGEIIHVTREESIQPAKLVPEYRRSNEHSVNQ